MSQFEVIVADPPWSFKDTLTMSDVARGAAANYHVMSNANIAQLPIKEFISPNGTILALWVPSSLLQEGLDTLKAWGFTHKQTYVWVKTKKESLVDLRLHMKKFMKHVWKITGLHQFKLKDYLELLEGSTQLFNLSGILSFGMGRLFRQTHEICLIGISSNKIYKHLNNKSQRSVSFGENLRHSAKPEHLQDSLDIMFPGENNAKLELFSRRQRKGWCCLGNEAPMTYNESIDLSLKKLLKISSTDYNNIMSLCHNQQKMFEMWKNYDL